MKAEKRLFKNTLIAILLMLLLPIPSKGDGYYWIYCYLEDWYESNETIYGNMTPFGFETDGSGVLEIDGKRYSTIYANDFSVLPTTRGNGSSFWNLENYKGNGVWPAIAIRHDNGRVYMNRTSYLEYLNFPSPFSSYGNADYLPYHLTDDGSEYILYDYNMEVGDKYRHVVGYEDISVAEKDIMTLDDGQEHRWLTLSNGLVLIEGVGCINSCGLLIDYLNPATKYLGNYAFLMGVEKVSGGSAQTTVFSSNVKYVDTSGNTGICDKGRIKDTRHEQTYDLHGRRLASPPAKGIYIQNGRKVVR